MTYSLILGITNSSVKSKEFFFSLPAELAPLILNVIEDKNKYVNKTLTDIPGIR